MAEEKPFFDIPQQIEKNQNRTFAEIISKFMNNNLSDF